jgi:hypothetical protein
VEETGGHAQHNVHKQVLDLVYGLQDKLDAQAKGGAAATSPASPAAGAGSPSHTKIAGLTVIGTQPKNGQKLTYNSSTGQIEWQ